MTRDLGYAPGLAANEEMTMYIEVPENLARRIYELAKGDDERLAELLGVVIDKYDEDPPKWATLGDLQRHAREAVKRYKTDSPTHIVANDSRSRQIVNAEFADHLVSRVEP